MVETLADLTKVLEVGAVYNLQGISWHDPNSQGHRVTWLTIMIMFISNSEGSSVNMIRYGSGLQLRSTERVDDKSRRATV